MAAKFGPKVCCLAEKPLVFCATGFKGVNSNYAHPIPFVSVPFCSSGRRHRFRGKTDTRAESGPDGQPAPTISKPVVDQTAQTIIYCYHRLVDKVRYPGTEITPAAFEAEMKELKDRGITVISLQDLLAWKRGEKNIPPRCAVITFDDGWKSQYEVAWPIMKKFGYTFTMFIYTEGVAGASLGGGQAITWEMLADMRDNGIDIEAHSATHQDLREGHTIMVMN